MAVEKDKILRAFDEAEDASEDFKEKMANVKEAKKQLKELIEKSYESEYIGESDYAAIFDELDNGDYGSARELLDAALKESALYFDEEEKRSFALAFKDTIEDIEDDVEQIRNSILKLAETDRNRSDLIDYLYGKHSKYTKTELRQFFKAVDGINKTGITTDDMARVLAAYNSSLNIGKCREIIRSMREA